MVLGLEKKGENWTWVNGKLVNMSKWAGEPKCKGAVAHIYASRLLMATRAYFVAPMALRNWLTFAKFPKEKQK